MAIATCLVGATCHASAALQCHRHVPCSRLPGLYGHPCASRRQIHLRGHLDARRTAVGKVEMRLRNHNQVHLPVQAAIKGKVRFLGIDAVTAAVVHRNAQLVPVPQMFRQIHPESGISPLMACQQLTVQAHLGRHGRGFHLQPDLAPRLHGGPFQLPHIPTSTAVIVVPSVLAVHRVPGMGQGHLSALPVLIEFPALFQRNHSSHVALLAFIYRVRCPILECSFSL